MTYLGDGWTNSTTGWHCSDNAGISAKYLANYDGSDALTGCPETSQVYAELNGPTFMDGVNLRSPDGYRHVYHEHRNNNSGQNVGPDNSYPIPTLLLKSFYGMRTVAGVSVRRTLYLDSDAAAAAVLGSAMRPGESMHADYVPAWDYPTMLQWGANCVGAKTTSTDNPTAHECNYSFIASDGSASATGTQLIIGNSPDGTRNPQIKGTVFTGPSASDYFAVPAMAGGNNFSRGRLRIRKGSN